jgi:putative protease
MTYPSPVLELLAPAKDADIGIEAVRHGADAVYIGGPAFSARANAGNAMSEIERLASYAHRFGSRVFMALNTIFTDRELEHARRLAFDAYEAGVDALIVQDMGLLEGELPPIELHASTQCDIRTPEKAKFLEDIGFKQIVPARELSLPEIAAMRDALTSARIECFIHGALCVSFSGQCYASFALKGRSANRGDCAQICRLPFDIYEEDGSLIRSKCHALSLKDNNQAEHLEAMIAAGVRSFKIEGRYKDLSYVKNTTAFYRRKLDSFIEAHPEFEPESLGRVELNFEPDPNRSFNRGTTDYFIEGRKATPITSFDTPKNAGSLLGVVSSVNPRSFFLKTKEVLQNGDGLTYYRKDGTLAGLLANRAEERDAGLWEVFPKDGCARLRDLDAGVTVLRNRDAAWNKKMNAETALRRIPIRIEASADAGRLTLKAEDARGVTAEVASAEGLEAAKNPERQKEQLKNALAKLGATDFEAESIDLQGEVPFLPASVMNELRRKLTDALEAGERAAFASKPEARIEKDETKYPADSLDFRGNVCNKKAREFYARHGVTVTQPAFETGEIRDEVELMRCKHCLRFSLGLCPKEAKKAGLKIRPTPLTLKYGPTVLTAHFHCKPCEMSVHGRLAQRGKE